MGFVKKFVGGQYNLWNEAPPMIWDGTKWERARVRAWDGSRWKFISGQKLELQRFNSTLKTIVVPTSDVKTATVTSNILALPNWSAYYEDNTRDGLIFFDWLELANSIPDDVLFTGLRWNIQATNQYIEYASIKLTLVNTNGNESYLSSISIPDISSTFQNITNYSDGWSILLNQLKTNPSSIYAIRASIEGGGDSLMSAHYEIRISSVGMALLYEG